MLQRKLPYLEAASVNRFGEISPLWLNLRSIRQSFEGLFRKYQSIFQPTLCKKVAIFQCFKYPNIEKIIQTSVHTGSSSFQGAAISHPLLGLLPPGCCHSDQKWGATVNASCILEAKNRFILSTPKLPNSVVFEPKIYIIIIFFFCD